MATWAESICVSNGIFLFDCIEFNDRFRCDDISSEVAFLAMDLDARGRPDLGYYFAERYHQYSGDHMLFRLLPFYRCYRAFVRGKVLSFQIDEPEFTASDRRQAAEKAQVFFHLARRYADPLPRPAVVVVGGLSGTGKTSLARAVAGELGLRVVSTDAVRGDLFGSEKRPAAHGEGAYGPKASRQTYEALIERGSRLLAEDGGVVLDGTFLEPYQREYAQALAERNGSALCFVECQLAPGAARERLERRHHLGDGLSDASWDIYLRQRESYQSIAKSPGWHWLTLDTGANLADCSRVTGEWLRTMPLSQ